MQQTTVKKILVLGGSGFVGRHVCSRLSLQHHQITVPTRRLPARHIQMMPGVSVVQADVHDAKQLQALVHGHDVVINLIAILHGTEDEFNQAHVTLPANLARACHATVNTVLQAAWAQLLMWLTGQRDVVFGTVVSGRPAEVPGAESVVGLLINTVPVRATLTATVTGAGLVEQLQDAHNRTLEHQHLGLNEIHRATGHEHLFDTLFVHENYPLDSAALGSADGLSITGFSASESNHYPLTLQTTPGPQLGLRLEYDKIGRAHV